jgi:hypothetical protein
MSLCDKKKALTWLNRLGFYDTVKPCKNNLYEGICVPRPQANFILYLSVLSFASAAYGFYRGHYFFACVPLAVGFTTILYWLNPTNCWRRYLDLAVAGVGVAIQLFYATNAQYALPYYVVKILALLCYPVGHYFHNLGQIWAGTFWHSGIHILGNLANVILYSGAI